MKIPLILFTLALWLPAIAGAAPEPLFSGEISSIEYYTTDISQGTGFYRDAKQKLEIRLYDHWAFICVTWKGDAGSPEKAEYIIPREKVLKIVVHEPEASRK